MSEKNSMDSVEYYPSDGNDIDMLLQAHTRMLK
jgi:hypothetical protein